MTGLATVLRWLGWAWLWIAAILILLNYAAIIYFSGWSQFREIANPFNLINTAIIILTFLPGIGLMKLGYYLQVRSSRSTRH